VSVVTHQRKARTVLNKTTDQMLVEDYLSHRDEKSFRELYRRHTPALYAFAMRFCESEPDAHDAIQDAWIRACDSLEGFQWKSSLRTWLTGILIKMDLVSGRPGEVDGRDSVPSREVVISTRRRLYPGGMRKEQPG
jgi:Sigma-70 region 2